MRGASLNLKQRILDRAGPPGAGVWTPVDFLDLGGRAAIDKALQRLVADGDLRRIDRGLYDRQANNKLTKAPAAPSTQAIIDAVARRDQARLLVDGMTAANDLGLTTAVPAQVVVLTDARLKPVQLGAQQIQFKQAAPSRLYWAGRPAMRVVQALFWLHDVLPSDRDAVLRRLRNLIVRDPRGGIIAADLQAGLSAMPIWMQTIVRDLIAQVHDADVDDDHLHRSGRDDGHADDGDGAGAGGNA
jgi:hypothetical protein